MCGFLITTPFHTTLFNKNTISKAQQIRNNNQIITRTTLEENKPNQTKAKPQPDAAAPRRCRRAGLCDGARLSGFDTWNRVRFATGAADNAESGFFCRFI